MPRSLVMRIVHVGKMNLLDIVFSQQGHFGQHEHFRLVFNNPLLGFNLLFNKQAQTLIETSTQINHLRTKLLQLRLQRLATFFLFLLRVLSMPETEMNLEGQDFHVVFLDGALFILRELVFGFLVALGLDQIFLFFALRSGG
jgi:hypothetical protein